MRDRFQSDEWREPPRRIGPIEPIDAARLGRVGRENKHKIEPLEILERNTTPIVAGIAALVLALAAYVFAADWLAGHL